MISKTDAEDFAGRDVDADLDTDWEIMNTEKVTPRVAPEVYFNLLICIDSFHHWSRQSRFAAVSKIFRQS